MLKGKVIIKRSLTSRTISKKIASFAAEKKAEDIIILDMRNIVNFCEYFVICSGNNDRQVKAIADMIAQGMHELDSTVGFRQGKKGSSWIVFDTGDIVVHIFQKQAREFYNLEHLWQEAKQVKWEPAKG